MAKEAEQPRLEGGFCWKSKADAQAPDGLLQPLHTIKVGHWHLCNMLGLPRGAAGKAAMLRYVPKVLVVAASKGP
jgi:hypothetical protein